MFSKRYALITAARNEERYIADTIKSVVAQTIPPQKWVIVSDGSTDRTDEMVRSYAEKYSFIQLISLQRMTQRNFGAQARALSIAYNQLRDLEFDFIGNLDSDITLVPNYYESILRKFEQNAKLGLAGGFIYELQRGEFRSRLFNNVLSVPHAVQFFRRECYELFGGYLPLKYAGADWHAEVSLRMKGFQVQSFPELHVFHHRPSATAEGIVKGRFRQGLMDYSVGSHPLIEIFRCLIRVKERPYLSGAMLRLSGFVWANVKREKRLVSMEFVDFLRKEQKQRAWSIILRNFKILSPKSLRLHWLA